MQSGSGGAALRPAACPSSKHPHARAPAVWWFSSPALSPICIVAAAPTLRLPSCVVANVARKASLTLEQGKERRRVCHVVRRREGRGSREAAASAQPAPRGADGTVRVYSQRERTHMHMRRCPNTTNFKIRNIPLALLVRNTPASVACCCGR